MHHTKFDIGDEVIVTHNGQKIKTVIVGINLRKKLMRFHQIVEETVSFEVEAFLGEKFEEKSIELLEKY